MARGEGAIVEDVDGNRFLDCAAGIAVNSTGHSHPDVVAAIVEQSQKFLHMSGTDFYYEPQVRLAEELASIVPIDGGVKIVLRQLGHRGERSGDQAGALSLEAAVPDRVPRLVPRPHARLARRSPSSRAVQRKGFGPVTTPGVFHAPYPDVYRAAGRRSPAQVAAESIAWIEERLFVHLVSPDEVAAIVVEPIQGEGGYIVPPIEFHQRLASWPKKHGILLDRRRSAVGHGPHRQDVRVASTSGCEPDIVSIAKGIASGLPLGVTAARADVMDWTPGAHASTFGGNPVACAAALATIKLLEGRAGRERRDGRRAPARPAARADRQKHPLIGDVRGKGLMIGIELVRDRETKERAIEERDLRRRSHVRQGRAGARRRPQRHPPVSAAGAVEGAGRLRRRRPRPVDRRDCQGARTAIGAQDRALGRPSPVAARGLPLRLGHVACRPIGSPSEKPAKTTPAASSSAAGTRFLPAASGRGWEKSTSWRARATRWSSSRSRRGGRTRFGEPVEAVDWRKRQTIARIAAEYVLRHSIGNAAAASTSSRSSSATGSGPRVAIVRDAFDGRGR